MESLRKKLWLIEGIATLLLVLALLPMGYGYYRFLRIVVCICAVLNIIGNMDQGFGWRNILLALIAILFNPILLIHLSRDSWVVIDLIAALWFGYSGTWHILKKKQIIHTTLNTKRLNIPQLSIVHNWSRLVFE